MTALATQKSKKGAQAYHAGLAAEASVTRDYSDRGYTVAAQRWRGLSGEIDLIVRHQNAVVFVEIKHSRNFERAIASLGKPQMQRIYAAAEEFIGSEPDGALTNVRFDVALVDGAGRIKILENAFGLG
ncbi:MAG: YraN family protein [Sulfitobacter sp.]